MPAKILPNITASAPAAIALAISPEYLMPPSAIKGTLPLIASLISKIAEIWGTPIPATILVVQIDPGPMPILMLSAPASNKAFAPSAEATLPAITS